MHNQFPPARPPAAPQPLSDIAREFALTNWRVAEKLKQLAALSSAHYGRSPESIEQAHVERLESVLGALTTALMDARVLKGGAV